LSRRWNRLHPANKRTPTKKRQVNKKMVQNCCFYKWGELSTQKGEATQKNQTQKKKEKDEDEHP